MGTQKRGPVRARHKQKEQRKEKAQGRERITGRRATPKATRPPKDRVRITEGRRSGARAEGCRAAARHKTTKRKEKRGGTASGNGAKKLGGAAQAVPEGGHTLQQRQSRQNEERGAKAKKPGPSQRKRQAKAISRKKVAKQTRKANVEKPDGGTEQNCEGRGGRQKQKEEGEMQQPEGGCEGV